MGKLYDLVRECTMNGVSVRPDDAEIRKFADAINAADPKEFQSVANNLDLVPYFGLIIQSYTEYLVKSVKTANEIAGRYAVECKCKAEEIERRTKALNECEAELENCKNELKEASDMANEYMTAYDELSSDSHLMAKRIAALEADSAGDAKQIENCKSEIARLKAEIYDIERGNR